MGNGISGTRIWSPQSLNALASLLPSHTRDSCIRTERQGNYFELCSEADTSMCFDLRGVDITNGSRVWLYPCNGTPAQQWIHDSQSRMRSAVDTNKCLVGSGGRTSSGTFLMIWDYFDNDTRFQFDRYKDGSMRAANDANICTDVSKSTSNLLHGRPSIIFYDYRGGDTQLWRW